MLFKDCCMLVFVFVSHLTACVKGGTTFFGVYFGVRPSPAQPENSIIVSFRESFSTNDDRLFCNESRIADETVLGIHTLKCTGGCSWDDRELEYRCTDVSTTNDLSTGVGELNYTYEGGEENKVFGLTANGLPPYIPSGNSFMYAVLEVNMTAREDTGKVNWSPVVGTLPVVRVHNNCDETIQLLVHDVEDDSVRCRWATVSPTRECLACTPADGPFSISEANCTISFNSSSSAEPGFYVLAVVVEDFSQDGVKISAVPMLFLAQVYNASVPCASRPTIPENVPANGAIIKVAPGQGLVTTVTAESNSNIEEVVTISPQGLDKSSLQQSGNEWRTELSWTPSEDQLGVHPFCFQAIDNRSISSEMRCFMFEVDYPETTTSLLETTTITSASPTTTAATTEAATTTKTTTEATTIKTTEATTTETTEATTAATTEATTTKTTEATTTVTTDMTTKTITTDVTTSAVTTDGTTTTTTTATPVKPTKPTLAVKPLVTTTAETTTTKEPSTTSQMLTTAKIHVTTTNLTSSIFVNATSDYNVTNNYTNFNTTQRNQDKSTSLELSTKNLDTTPTIKYDRTVATSDQTTVTTPDVTSVTTGDVTSVTTGDVTSVTTSDVTSVTTGDSTRQMDTISYDPGGVTLDQTSTESNTQSPTTGSNQSKSTKVQVTTETGTTSQDKEGFTDSNTQSSGLLGIYLAIIPAGLLLIFLIIVIVICLRKIKCIGVRSCRHHEHNTTFNSDNSNNLTSMTSLTTVVTSEKTTTSIVTSEKTRKVVTKSKIKVGSKKTGSRSRSRSIHTSSQIQGSRSIHTSSQIQGSRSSHTSNHKPRSTSTSTGSRESRKSRTSMTTTGSSGKSKRDPNFNYATYSSVAYIKNMYTDGYWGIPGSLRTDSRGMIEEV